MKKLVLLALLVTIVIVGGYWAYTTSAGSAGPAAGAQTANSADSTFAPPPTLANPTIVTAQLNKDGIPAQVGTMSLQSSKVGTDTLGEFESMHGSSFNLKTGYRADYADGAAKATLWVGQAQSADSAQTLTKEMADKIGAGNAMFTNLRTLTITGRTIYEVEGLGQLHFFYAANDKIVWLASDADHAPDALHSIWGALK